MSIKKLVPFLLITALILGVSCNETKQLEVKSYNQGLNITPIPLELTLTGDTFQLSNQTVFVASQAEAEKIAAFFGEKIKRSTGIELKILKQKADKQYINLFLSPDLQLREEGYILEVTKEGVDIQAKTPHGLFYGMQTVMQLLPAEVESSSLVTFVDWKIPTLKIKDEPRFRYRGIHLDVCRHFADVDFIKKQLDVLALFKINRFHWHLTEDQGWRIEIKKYPKLTQMGSVRTEGEGNTYGPYFYTQEEVKEIVAYAKERFIEVIPEIELPGHAVAALNAYPELSCTGKPIEVRNIWGVATDVFCAGNDSTFQFLDDVITELIPLFESDNFHIGGDECPKLRWQSCPKCQARIKELGLKADKDHSAEEKLQSYFVQRIEKVLLKHNKKMIGWDEILEGGLAPSATVMSWRGEEGGIASAQMGHDVIMTPGAWLYMDKYQGDSKILPVTIGGLLPLEKVYSYDPLPEKIEESKKHHVLGAQVNVWSEYNYNEYDMEYDIYPRVIALAELTWSAKERKDYPDFERRMDNQRVRLDMHRINYYIPMPEQKGVPSCNFVAFTDQAVLEFKTTEPVKMVYTTDGSEPDQHSTAYSEGLTFTENTTLKIRSVLPSGVMSPVRSITIEKQNFLTAVEKPSEAKPGLEAHHIKGYVQTVSDLEGKEIAEKEQVATPQEAKHRIHGYMEVYPDDFYSTVLTGYMNIPEDGVYYFSTDCEFSIGDQYLISNEKDNQGTARRFSRSDKSIALSKGYHPIKIVRLGGIFGGWPTQWDPVLVYIRKADEPSFQRMDESFFK